ncbi:transcriptional adapter 2-alpha-like isoform X2 [Dysidea avara]|uniref:transcriptional adapter 2-alpha-like isoform X2 n=1 Tax=Dysidea avara TaxID=196820 RepID=UPI0033279E39
MAEDTWGLEDEANLLDAISDCGYGNWTAISCRVNKRPNACKHHYESCFIRNPIYEGLPVLPLRSTPYHRSPVTLKSSDNPPRPTPNSHHALSLASYWPARGEFSVEWDDTAVCESDFLAKLSFDADDDDQLMRALKFQVVDVYRRLLLERKFKRRIIRDYGLLSPRKQTGVGKSKLKRNQYIHKCLIPFMRLVTPEEAEKMLQSLFYEANLRDDIVKLQNYRLEGITSVVGADLYETLSHQRMQDIDNEKRRPSKEELLFCYMLKQNGMNLDEMETITVYKNKEKPLPQFFDITGALGIEKLDKEEKELCSTIRLMPETYLSSKSVLLSECIKRNGLRLLDARKQLKIDEKFGSL